MVLQARVYSAKVVDRDGIKLLLGFSVADELPRLKQVCLEAGYTGQEETGAQAGCINSDVGAKEGARVATFVGRFVHVDHLAESFVHLTF